jgi:hypothetical protein
MTESDLPSARALTQAVPRARRLVFARDNQAFN